MNGKGKDKSGKGKRKNGISSKKTAGAAQRLALINFVIFEIFFI
jgi:hypothetical protein